MLHTLHSTLHTLHSTLFALHSLQHWTVTGETCTRLFKQLVSQKCSTSLHSGSWAASCLAQICARSSLSILKSQFPLGKSSFPTSKIISLRGKVIICPGKISTFPHFPQENHQFSLVKSCAGLEPDFQPPRHAGGPRPPPAIRSSEVGFTW